MADSSYPQCSPRWYMLKDGLPNAIITMPDGQGIRNKDIEEGSLFVAYDALDSYTVKLQALQDPRNSVTCKTSMLIPLDVEDVNWLNPIKPPKDRIRLYNNQQHWAERKLLEVGHTVNFTTTVTNLKGKGTILNWGHSKSRGGRVIEIQMKVKYIILF